MSDAAGWQRAHRLAGFDACFVPYLRWLMRGNVAGLWLRSGDAFPAHGGYVAVANHHSWWDGFVPYLLHHTREATQPFGLMMSQRELRRFPYFRLGGAFSIDAASIRAALPSVLYAASEAQQGAAIWIFPDGVLRPPLIAPAFTSGFVHIARDAGVPIVPVAMRFLMLAKQRPEVFVAIGPPVSANRRDARALGQGAVVELLDAIDRDVREDAVARRYRLVVRGASGVDDRLAPPSRRP